MAESTWVRNASSLRDKMREREKERDSVDAECTEWGAILRGVLSGISRSLGSRESSRHTESRSDTLYASLLAGYISALWISFLSIFVRVCVRVHATSSCNVPTRIIRTRAEDPEGLHPASSVTITIT